MGQSNKGMSPVIATLILVVMAVVIAAALAGFSSSLIGEYNKAENQITPYEYGYTEGKCSEKFSNAPPYNYISCLEGRMDKLNGSKKE